MTDSNDISVLVVDDTPANLGLLVDYLGQHDYKVLVARDGAVDAQAGVDLHREQEAVQLGHDLRIAAVGVRRHLVENGLPKSDMGRIGLAVAPANPDVIYAAMWRGERKPWTIISGMQESAREDGIWRSEDGGDTWDKLANGLPDPDIGKIGLICRAEHLDRVDDGDD